MHVFRPLAAILVLCAPLVSAQTLTPFLLHDINEGVEARSQALLELLQTADPSHDDFFYMSTGPTAGVWHAGASDTADYFVSDAYHMSSCGALTFFWTFASPLVTLKATDGTTAGIRTLGQFPGMMGAAPCGRNTCFSAGNNLVGVSDGTAAGTRIITSTEPSVTGIDLPSDLVSTGDAVYFTAFDLDHGECFDSGETGVFCGELWTSDGTAAGTHLVSDLIPGPFPSAPSRLYSWAGKIYFNAFAPDKDTAFRYIYVSDGTANGTLRLTDKASLAIGDSTGFVGSGKYVYFGSDQLQVWRTEGTPESTVSIHDLAGLQDPAWVDGVIPSPQIILFDVIRSLNTSTSEMWSYDGTHAIKIRDMPSNAGILGYWPATNRFYYTVFEGGDQDPTLYETDGTSVGRAVTRLPGVTSCGLFRPGAHVAHFITSNLRSDDWELWQTDGTASGTHRVHNETPVGLSSNPTSLFSLPNRLLFFANDGQALKLFTSDGNTQAVAVSPQLTCSSSGRCPTPVVSDGQVYVQQGSDWWMVDGATATPLSKSFGAGSVSPLTPPVHLGNSQYLIGYSGTVAQLWRNDSTSASSIASFPGFDRSNRGALVSVGSRLFLSDGTTLWTSDGTSQGTLALTSGPQVVGVQALMASDNGVYFQHNVNNNGQVWFSDGTPAGTGQVAIANELSTNLMPSTSTVWHGMLFFVDSTGGRLWRTRPGTGGTIELPQFLGHLSYFADLGDRLALVWTDTNTSATTAVWTTDGTVNGTSLQYSIDQVLRALPPIRLSNGDVYLPVQASSKRVFLNLRTGNQIEIPYTMRVPAFESYEDSLVAVGTRAIFAATTTRAGREVWAVDLAGSSPAGVPVVSVSFSGVTSVGSQRAAVFRITLAGDSLVASSLRFETTDGTLHSGHDYTATAGTVSIPLGQTVRTVVVPVGDGNGTFNLVLTQPDNAAIATGFATATVPPTALRRHPSRP